MKKDKTIQAKFTARDEMGNEWLSDVFEDVPKIRVEEDGITYEGTPQEYEKSFISYLGVKNQEKLDAQKQENYYYRTLDLIVDFNRHRVTKNEKEIHIDSSCWVILEKLIKNNGCVVKRDTLKQALEENSGHSLLDGYVSVVIGRVRKVLEEDKDTPYIGTDFKMGYHWKAPIVKEKYEIA